MKCLKRLQVLWNLLKVCPQPDIDWTGDDQRQLSQFLKNTSAGVKLTVALRGAIVESALTNGMGNTSDRALYGCGVTAGYIAAAAIVDSLAGANLGADSAEADSPAPSSDLEWMTKN